MINVYNQTILWLNSLKTRLEVIGQIHESYFLK